METIVRDRFCIQIYLDTNILVDYVEQNNPLLDASLHFLSACPFVKLRSSHYVKFEFIEVRKRREFYRCVRNRLPSASDKDTYGRDWILDGHDYNEYKDQIVHSVNTDLEKIKDNLKIDFNNHILHQNLLEPTKDICLSSKISREDCLVMISCVYPHPSKDERLEFSVVLSNDQQYKTAYIENQETIDTILQTYGLNLPEFLCIKELPYTTKNVDLNNTSQKIDIKLLWTHIISQLLILKNKDIFVGYTIKAGKSREDFIFFDIIDKNKVLLDSEAITFIAYDLSGYITVMKDFDYWNNSSAISLPFSDTTNTQYSLIKKDIDKPDLNILQRKGNLIFYEND